MRVRKLAMTLLALLLAVPAFAPAPADAAQSLEALTRRLLEINGFHYQIGQTPATLKQQFESQRGQAGLPADEWTFMMEVILEAFEAEPLYQSVVGHVARLASRERLDTVLAYLQTPVGKKMTRLEKAASGPEARTAMLQFAQGLKDNPPPEGRAALIKELDQAALLFETTLESVVDLSMVVAMALNAAKRGPTLWNEQQFGLIRNRVREQLRPRLAGLVTLQMLHTYREASDGDLRDYIDFHKTEVGAWYVRTMHEGIHDAIVKAAWRAGKKIQLKSVL